LANWLFPKQVVVLRNQDFRLHTGTATQPPLRPNAHPVQIGVQGLNTGSAGIWLAVAVQTPPSQTPPPSGDYFAIRGADVKSDDRVTPNSIGRNPTGPQNGWRQVGPDLPGAAASLQISDAGNAVYVLLKSGHVIRLTPLMTGPEPTGATQWSDRSDGLTH